MQKGKGDESGMPSSVTFNATLQASSAHLHVDTRWVGSLGVVSPQTAKDLGNATVWKTFHEKDETSQGHKQSGRHRYGLQDRSPPGHLLWRQLWNTRAIVETPEEVWLFPSLMRKKSQSRS